MLMSRDYTEFKERLHTIDEKIKKAGDIRKSLSDNRNAYREFASNIDIDFSVLLTAFDFYVPALLIDIYTFCEQLFKKFIYNILDAEIDELDNKHVYKFIKSVLPEDKFSPDIKVKNIDSQLKKYIFMDENKIDKISLLKIPENKVLFQSYDKLIEHRHTYAHQGKNSGFDLELIKDGFKVAEFLLNEIININNYFSHRVKFQKIIEEIRKEQKKLEEKPENYKTKQSINATAKKIKKHSIKGIRVLKKMNTDSKVLQNLNDSLIKLSEMDLRRKREIILREIKENKL
mgnify:CR=1 FL=1